MQLAMQHLTALQRRHNDDEQQWKELRAADVQGLNTRLQQLTAANDADACVLQVDTL